ncbi:LLM class flavin-dependent oxidoreductase [Microbacterium betulae]|uniref:LLM class flavin-dependent oxidoreductase n=1 Tax=Microbacterium betulae TaxID=2981139 RepID=A0AA97FHC5_9MICO|nr:LLM class flavin-dependent oxidoreductase [Microbacterium sp. AB]WOF23198.1 LLM class flavin-dependent oxidoreductase [Microbacterium sp. AB]
MPEQVHVAVALEGAGWHPAAWRDPSARPRELVSPAYWRELLRTADDAAIAFATVEDALSLPVRGEAEPAPGHVGGRLDAVLVASFAAPLTRRIGLIPTVTTAHPEPFHVATGVQTLDHASRGRAGVRLVVGAPPAEVANFGRRSDAISGLPASGRVEDSPEVLAAFREAGEFADVLGRLWDSWQDDAIVRDVATGRYLDADRVHRIDFEGEFFSVTGASIVPRSPQGRPIVTALAHQSVPYRFAAEHADVVFVTPRSAADAAGIRTELDAAPRAAGTPLRVFADLLVLVEESRSEARAAKARLDALAGAPLASDARIVAGTPDDVVEEIRALAAAGVDGVRLRPARLPRDLLAIAERVVPRLNAADALLDAAADTLRGRLGLPRPESRYAREKALS